MENTTIFNCNQDPKDVKDDFGIPIEAQAPGTSYSFAKLIVIVIALMLSLFVAAVDETIVSTSLATIGTEFNASGKTTWIAISYLLTATSFEPIYGKFSIIFGTKRLLIISITIFVLGSIGCGVSTTIAMLATFRGIAGIGGGGLISLSFITMTNLIPIEKRGIYMGLLSGTFTVSDIIGPLLGGVFVDYLNWRWSFYINIPIGAVVLTLILFTIPSDNPVGTFKSMIGRIDWIGTLSLIVGIILLVLGISWGGKEYPWGSIPVILSICIGLIVLGIFVYIEIKVAVEPIIPIKMFTRNAALLNIIALMYGTCMFVYMYYWPLYHQIIHSATATRAGIENFPLLIGICGFSIIIGYLISYTGTYRKFFWCGMTFLVLGTSLMARLSLNISRPEEVIYLLLIGIGIGLSMEPTIIAVQASVTKENVPIATSFVNFCFLIGGVIGLSIQGSIYSNVLVNNLKKSFSLQETIRILDSMAYLRSLPSDLHALALEAYIVAFRTMFLSLIPFASIGLFATFFVEHIPFNSNSD